MSRTSSLVGHDALRGGDDGNAKAAEHAGQLIRADVNTQAGLADTAQAGDDLVLAVVLQGGKIKKGDILEKIEETEAHID